MKRIMINELNNYINGKVEIRGWIYKIRKLKYITFIIVRDRSGVVQCVIDNNKIKLSEIKLESIIYLNGTVQENSNKLNAFEINTDSLEIINSVLEELPIEINKEDLQINLDTMLNNRMISLRHKKINSIFKIQNIITNGFRKFLIKNGFTEIHTPKIVEEGAEGGTELFRLKYFEKDAYLSQSPQFYKQMMVGASFERVFEIGHVYRAEEHNTNRHHNEFRRRIIKVYF